VSPWIHTTTREDNTVSHKWVRQGKKNKNTTTVVTGVATAQATHTKLVITIKKLTIFKKLHTIQGNPLIAMKILLDEEMEMEAAKSKILLQVDLEII